VQLTFQAPVTLPGYGLFTLSFGFSTICSLDLRRASERGGPFGAGLCGLGR